MSKEKGNKKSIKSQEEYRKEWEAFAEEKFQEARENYRPKQIRNILMELALDESPPLLTQEEVRYVIENQIPVGKQKLHPLLVFAHVDASKLIEDGVSDLSQLYEDYSFMTELFQTQRVNEHGQLASSDDENSMTLLEYMCEGNLQLPKPLAQAEVEGLIEKIQLYQAMENLTNVSNLEELRVSCDTAWEEFENVSPYLSSDPLEAVLWSGNNLINIEQIANSDSISVEQLVKASVNAPNKQEVVEIVGDILNKRMSNNKSQTQAVKKELADLYVELSQEESKSKLQILELIAKECEIDVKKEAETSLKEQSIKVEKEIATESPVVEPLEAQTIEEAEEQVKEQDIKDIKAAEQKVKSEKVKSEKVKGDDSVLPAFPRTLPRDELKHIVEDAIPIGEAEIHPLLLALVDASYLVKSGEKNLSKLYQDYDFLIKEFQTQRVNWNGKSAGKNDKEAITVLEYALQKNIKLRKTITQTKFQKLQKDLNLYENVYQGKHDNLTEAPHLKRKAEQARDILEKVVPYLSSDPLEAVLWSKPELININEIAVAHSISVNKLVDAALNAPNKQEVGEIVGDILNKRISNDKSVAADILKELSVLPHKDSDYKAFEIVQLIEKRCNLDEAKAAKREENFTKLREEFAKRKERRFQNTLRSLPTLEPGRPLPELTRDELRHVVENQIPIGKRKLHPLLVFAHVDASKLIEDGATDLSQLYEDYSFMTELFQTQRVNEHGQPASSDDENSMTILEFVHQHLKRDGGKFPQTLTQEEVDKHIETISVYQQLQEANAVTKLKDFKSDYDSAKLAFKYVAPYLSSDPLEAILWSKPELININEIAVAHSISVNELVDAALNASNKQEVGEIVGDILNKRISNDKTLTLDIIADLLVLHHKFDKKKDLGNMKIIESIHAKCQLAMNNNKKPAKEDLAVAEKVMNDALKYCDKKPRIMRHTLDNLPKVMEEMKNADDAPSMPTREEIATAILNMPCSKVSSKLKTIRYILPEQKQFERSELFEYLDAIVAAIVVYFNELIYKGTENLVKEISGKAWASNLPESFKESVEALSKCVAKELKELIIKSLEANDKAHENQI